jgi:hypothetical protein
MARAVDSPQSIVARERSALAVHRESLRAGVLPAPKSAPRGTFVHGLMLPLSLFMATLRSPQLRRPYLRLAGVRVVVLLVVGVMAWVSGGSDDDERGKGVTIGRDEPAASVRGPVDVDAPGFHMHIDESKKQGNLTLLGQEVPIEVNGEGSNPAPAPAPPPASRFGRLRDGLRRGWKQIVAFVGLLSVVEGIIVFFSRRWDDWLSFYLSGLAGVRPELPEPPVRKLASRRRRARTPGPTMAWRLLRSWCVPSPRRSRPGGGGGRCVVTAASGRGS